MTKGEAITLLEQVSRRTVKAVSAKGDRFSDALYMLASAGRLQWELPAWNAMLRTLDADESSIHDYLVFV